jgi:hypothetical protein
MVAAEVIERRPDRQERKPPAPPPPEPGSPEWEERESKRHYEKIRAEVLRRRRSNDYIHGVMHRIASGK